MKADISDKSFMDAMSDLLDIDTKKITEFLSKLDAQGLMDLTDAVATGNRREALRVIKTVEDDSGEHLLNPLLKGRDADLHNSDKDGADEIDDHNIDEEDDVDDELAIGDAVSINIDGKRYKATVKNPRAPGKTVGVLLKGKHRMVDRKDVSRMDEMVLGMSEMGSLARMQQLAGIVPAGETITMDDPTSYEVSYPADNDFDDTTDNAYDPRGSDDEKGVMSPFAEINAALDTVERVMPGLTLGNAGEIKKRIYAISASLNEGVSSSRKPIVVASVRKKKR